jgi:hypothetical protein
LVVRIVHPLQFSLRKIKFLIFGWKEFQKYTLHHLEALIINPINQTNQNELPETKIIEVCTSKVWLEEKEVGVSLTLIGFEFHR